MTCWPSSTTSPICTPLSRQPAPGDSLAYLDPEGRWTSLATVVRVPAQRTVASRTGQAVRYFITNLPLTTAAKRIAQLGCQPWGIENSLPWVLDDTCGEDRSRLRRDWAARNMAAWRHLALHILTVLKATLRTNMPIRRLRKQVAHNPAKLEMIKA